VSTAAAVAARLTWTRRETRFEELDPMNRLLAVTETVTHLELLARTRQVDRSRIGESISYGVAA
jgi:hypothetical protein